VNNSNPEKVAKVMVMTACIGAEHGLFNRIRQVAPMLSCLIHGSLGQHKSAPKQHLNRFKKQTDRHSDRIPCYMQHLQQEHWALAMWARKLKPIAHFCTTLYCPLTDSKATLQVNIRNITWIPFGYLQLTGLQYYENYIIITQKCSFWAVYIADL